MFNPVQNQVIAARPRDPLEEVSIPLYGAPNSGSLVRLSTRAATAEYFKLFGLHQQDPFREIKAGYEFITDPGRTRKQSTGWFRIAYGFEPGKTRASMSRFRLSSGWKLATLQYLTDYLNSTGVPWLYLANGHGGKVSRGAFHAITSDGAAA